MSDVHSADFFDVVPKRTPGSGLRATFFKDGASVFVRIKNIHDKFSIVERKATGEDTARFPAEYAAYESGLNEVEVVGTKLTEVPGITPAIERNYKLKGIRTAEELAGLSDAGCQNIGLGGITNRKAAQHMLAAKRLEALEAVAAEKPARKNAAKTAA